MQIKLLGTASAEGMPALFCRCQVCEACRLHGGKDLRTRSSAVIDGLLKIDMSPDTLSHVQHQGLDLTAIEYLLFTHGHDDHCAVSELQYMSWMFVAEPRASPLPIYGPENVIARIRRTLDLDILPVELHCLDLWERSQIGPYGVTPLLAAHDPEHVCFNYIIERAGSSMLHATDTGWYGEETWSYLESTSLQCVIVECTKGIEGNGYEGHLSIPEVIRFRDRLVSAGALQATAPVVTTHHGHLGGLLHEELEQKLVPHGIQPGYDGMEISL